MPLDSSLIVIALFCLLAASLCGPCACYNYKPASYYLSLDEDFDLDQSLQSRHDAERSHSYIANEAFDNDSHSLPSSRSKRSVRPTKSYDFKESDAAVPGAIMFQLDRKHPLESFKIENPSRWVTVDANGAVRVKDAWDYEQLGKEKTIDFWVFVTGPNVNGE